MTSHDELTDSGEVLRHKQGMGLAARITLGLAGFSLLFAIPATFILLLSAQSLNEEAAEDARRQMAAETHRMAMAGAELPPNLQVQEYPAAGGLRVQVAQRAIPTRDGEREARAYLVVRSDEGLTRERTVLYGPAANDPSTAKRLLVLVLLVTGGLVLVVIVVGGVISRRAFTPVRDMIEDVLAVSRGRVDHAMRAHHAIGEVGHLARAVDRMVKGFAERQESQEQLAKSLRETELLRELRRNLRPMTVEPPSGYTLETKLVTAAGAGTGDFVDALSDEEGRPTLIVGATAARGTPGALLMAMTRAYLRGAVLQGQSPPQACDTTNTSLNRDLARGLYASAMVLRLDPSRAQVELVSAGHKAPAVRWDAEHGQLRKLQPNGIALAFDDGPVFRRSLEVVTVDLGPGDGLFLFSPTAFEVENAQGRQLGEKGVYALAKYAIDHGLDEMEQKLLAFLGGSPGSDLAFALLRHQGAAA